MSGYIGAGGPGVIAGGPAVEGGPAVVGGPAGAGAPGVVGIGVGVVPSPLGTVVKFRAGVVPFMPVAVVGKVVAPGAGVAEVVFSADVVGGPAVVDSAGVGVPVTLPVAVVGMVSALGTCTFLPST